MVKKYNCGQLRLAHTGQQVSLHGWVNNVRLLGNLIFIDLRDQWGITQIICNRTLDNFDQLKKVRTEDVVHIIGLVQAKKQANKHLATGAIEILAHQCHILSRAKELPFTINSKGATSEATRLKYRYLDLRRAQLQHNLKVKSQLLYLIHNFFHNNDFLNLETPILSAPTPEGARNFVVPSRLLPGKYYALAQSPQLYKQMLMIGGLGNYYQIARCFRDEDFRSDRQPEFSQLDVEMTWATVKGVQTLIEQLCRCIWKTIKNIDIPQSFMHISYADAIDKYGTDKPDLRFDNKLFNVESIFSNTSSSFLQKFINAGLTIKAMFVPSMLISSQIKDLQTVAQQYGTGLFIVKIDDKQVWTGSLAKQLSEAERQQLLSQLNAKHQAGTFCLVADKYHLASCALGAIRSKVAQMLYQFDPDLYKFAWVIDAPLFEYSEQEKRYVALHHPFTKPQSKHLLVDKTNYATMRAEAYDLVINGYEVGGGSLRINEADMQVTVFKLLGMSDQAISDRFGWFIEALKYGTPEHGGIALGIDRITMLLVNDDNIRNVIPFPKNNMGADKTTESPASIDTK